MSLRKAARFLPLILLFSFQPFAYAIHDAGSAPKIPHYEEGTESTGGGGGVLCEDPFTPTMATIQLLDFYEARRFGFEPQFPLAEAKEAVALDNQGRISSFNSFIQMVSARLYDALEDGVVSEILLRPARALNFRDQYNRILDPIQVLSWQSEIPQTLYFKYPISPYSTRDLGIPMREVVPSNCSVIQLARQHRSSYDLADTNVALTAWVSGLPLQHKAGLILHEILHSWFYGAPTTMALRQTVIYLAAPDDFRERNKDIIRKVILTRQAAPIEAFRL